MHKPEQLPPVNLKELYANGYAVHQLDPEAVSELYAFFKGINYKDHAFDCTGIETEGAYHPPMYGLTWDNLYDPETPAPVMTFWNRVLESDFLKYFVKRYGDFEKKLASVAFHTPGDGLPWHNDYGPDQWHMALVMYLTDEAEWNEEWGGAIHFGEWEVSNETGVGVPETVTDISGPIKPRHARLIAIFGTKIDIAHRVEAMKIQKERITVMLHLRLPGDHKIAPGAKA